jgi:dihydropteroate synthase
MKPLVMGVLNVTPDSFSDGGEHFSTHAAVAWGLEMIAAGADVVDVGGESSRPRAVPVSEAEELARVLPVIRALSGRVRLSIDTTKAEVARQAVGAGADLVNDISASDELCQVAAQTGAGWVAMHMQGSPATMQEDPHYDDVVGEVGSYLAERVALARSAGVKEVWADPGIGFGKTKEHNLALLAHLPALAAAAGAPLVVGTSRKSFLWRIAADPAGPLNARDALEPSLATAVWAMDHGAAMVRVHDVAPTVAAVRLLHENVGIEVAA